MPSLQWWLKQNVIGKKLMRHAWQRQTLPNENNYFVICLILLQCNYPIFTPMSILQEKHKLPHWGPTAAHTCKNRMYLTKLNTTATISTDTRSLNINVMFTYTITDPWTVTCKFNWTLHTFSSIQSRVRAGYQWRNLRTFQGFFKDQNYIFKDHEDTFLTL